jgi:hypothetical protein
MRYKIDKKKRTKRGYKRRKNRTIKNKRFFKKGGDIDNMNSPDFNPNYRDFVAANF